MVGQIILGLFFLNTRQKTHPIFSPSLHSFLTRQHLARAAFIVILALSLITVVIVSLTLSSSSSSHRRSLLPFRVSWECFGISFVLLYLLIGFITC
ncbi:hypothetical protein TorRG33x02_182080 [Trema orientale]|uniref:Transmembrane protein n=1 Tax=Trema orientale TaxID=63057 RepID=A0A2P5EKE3_TREOI|nr:hypothetical protein TorRG33x02_182080 [Trema orientale]